MKKCRSERRIKKHTCRIAAVGLLFVLLAGLLPAEDAQASGERAAFGSDSYSWELDEVTPIGIYGICDDATIESVSCTVIYDPDMLEYSYGGTLTEDGEVEIYESGIGSSEYKGFIYFTPVTGGQTTVKIKNMVITDTAGNETQVDNASVKVDIEVPSSCQLDGISVNGTAVEGFDSSVTVYSMDVGSDAETAEIEVSPDSVTTEVSDTTLSEGKNKIYLTVTGSDGEQAVYTLTVNRDGSGTAVSDGEDTEDTEDSEDAEGTESEITRITGTEEEEESDSGRLSGFGTALRNAASYIRLVFAFHPILWIVVLVIVVIIVILLVFLGLAKRRRAQKKREEAQRLARQQRREARRYREETGDDFAGDGTAQVTASKEESTASRPVRDVSNEYTPLRRDIPQIATMSAESGAVAGRRTEREIFAALAGGLEAPDVLDEGRPVIRVEHVSMDFKVEHDEASSLKESTIRSLKGQRHVRKLRALNDISFTVNSGEVIGIIGTNGSGKSTLLKIISGALLPTEGSVDVDKSKVQLLTLGTGFDRELTGRENVYLNGSLIGYSKEFIDEHYDEIVEFAELESFMEERVKNYSSGMVSRLGFAIATVGKAPEILILDEVMAVGDTFFRRKSEQRIREMIHGGATVLIVSHSMPTIRKNCNRVIWIEKSRLRMTGSPEKVCTAYENMKD